VFVGKNGKRPKVWVDIMWRWTKITIFICIILGIAFGYGTFYPNKIAIKKVNSELEQFYITKIDDLELREPEFVYHNDVQFVRALHKCIDYINFSLTYDKRVPYEMIIAQAALESGWGNSRFANEGNNLFGIRTWNKDTEHMIPLGVKKWPGWGVRVFATKCESVKEYVRILNDHPAYKKFREKRKEMLDNRGEMDSLILIRYIDKFSTTADYDKRVALIIKKIRKLEDKFASDKNINGND
jgi:Bax protein